jgi:hypothetical protein
MEHGIPRYVCYTRYPKTVMLFFLIFIFPISQSQVAEPEIRCVEIGN